MKLQETQTSCDRDWVPYSDTKCYKVFDKLGTEPEAKTFCDSLNSSLITIQNEKEQMFSAQLLSKHRSLAENVWIGLKYVNGKFTWSDYIPVSYQNWDSNAIKDGSNQCVDMITNDVNIGKWMDDNCNKKYLIACQKKQNSKTVLGEEVKNLTEVIEKTAR